MSRLFHPPAAHSAALGTPPPIASLHIKPPRRVNARALQLMYAWYLMRSVYKVQQESQRYWVQHCATGEERDKYLNAWQQWHGQRAPLEIHDEINLISIENQHFPIWIRTVPALEGFATGIARRAQAIDRIEIPAGFDSLIIACGAASALLLKPRYENLFDLVRGQSTIVIPKQPPCPLISGACYADGYAVALDDATYYIGASAQRIDSIDSTADLARAMRVLPDDCTENAQRFFADRHHQQSDYSNHARIHRRSCLYARSNSDRRRAGGSHLSMRRAGGAWLCTGADGRMAVGITFMRFALKLRCGWS